MSIKIWPAKDPNEVLDYGINWAPVLTEGETIESSAWELAADGITMNSHSYDAEQTTIWLSGGVEGESYTMVNRITTSGGRTYDQSVKLRVKTK